MSEKRTHSEELKLLAEVAYTSPALLDYWRKRQEGYKKEQLNKQFLREANIPPYFHNVLGGAMWWELNKIAGDAVNQSEGVDPTCVCYRE